ncbi:MAG: hypothetical protein K9J81_06215 [Desulfohalobiaceae bacterium]|nr:hypothetical protein [Desulfohalobiaceae bacterium]
MKEVKKVHSSRFTVERGEEQEEVEPRSGEGRERSDVRDQRSGRGGGQREERGRMSEIRGQEEAEGRGKREVGCQRSEVRKRRRAEGRERSDVSPASGRTDI